MTRGHKQPKTAVKDEVKSSSFPPLLSGRKPWLVRRCHRLGLSQKAGSNKPQTSLDSIVSRPRIPVTQSWDSGDGPKSLFPDCFDPNFGATRFAHL